MEKNLPFLAGLNQYWLVLQKVKNKINNIVIENYVYSIDSQTKMDQQFKAESQCQGHKISIFIIVENHGFSAILNQFWKILQKMVKNNIMIVDDYASSIDSKTRIDQEFKAEGQGHNLCILKNGEKQGFKLI